MRRATHEAVNGLSSTVVEEPTDTDLRILALERATTQYGQVTFTAEEAVARAEKFLAFLKGQR